MSQRSSRAVTKPSVNLSNCIPRAGVNSSCCQTLLQNLFDAEIEGELTKSNLPFNMCIFLRAFGSRTVSFAENGCDYGKKYYLSNGFLAFQITRLTMPGTRRRQLHAKVFAKEQFYRFNEIEYRKKILRNTFAGLLGLTGYGWKKN